MEILILTPKGETVKMSTRKGESVIDLKRRMSERLFIAPDLERILFFHGRVLDDENSLDQFAIEDKSVITLVEGLRGGIRIWARTINGSATGIEIDPTETVFDLKKKIKEKIGIDEDLQKLVSAGRMLDDEKKLQDYPIMDGSEIHVIARLRGCGKVATVQTSEGERATIPFGEKETVLDLKKKIAERFSITPDLQVLKFQGGILDDDEKDLSGYAFCCKRVIDLTELSRQILVRTPGGGTVRLEISGTRTVRDLKKRIATKLSLSFDELNLVFRDIVLEDDTMIDKLNILKDSIIFVHIIKRRIYFEKDGKEIFVQVGMEEKVSEIKRRICEKAQSSSTDVQLCYKGGRRLEDDKTLLDYKIEDTTRIRVLFL